MTKSKTPPKVPKAKKKNFWHKKFKDKILDPYSWLNRRDHPEILKYLKEENNYAQHQLKALETLKTRLFKEMKSRLPEKQDQEPIPIDDYFYYKTWKKQKQYPIYKRRHRLSKKEEIILDGNLIKTKSKYLDIARPSVSVDHKILAYPLDDQGREFYNIYFKNLGSGRLLKFFISQATSDFVWANDNKTVFYVQQDKKTLRAFQVYRFDITTGNKQLIFEEKDLKFNVFLSKSLCRTWIMITAFSSQSTEYHYLPANKPLQDLTLFCRRKANHEYHIHYGDGDFYILSNKDKAFNFKLMKVSEKSAKKKGSAYPQSLWQKLIPHRSKVFIENYEVFKRFIVLSVRREGRQEIEIFDKEKRDLFKIDFPESIYSVTLGVNREYHSPFCRLEFQSLTQPKIIYDYETAKRKLHFKSQDQVKGAFDFRNYISLAKYATAKDGSKIPISLVHKKDTKLCPSSPLLLYAYGSYGISMDLVFNPSWLSLLDRGFICAIAHIRGGSEKGRKWYEGGRLLNKKNTFTDFISCAEFLIQKSYTSNEHLYIMGGSAGGLLIGAVLNERPDLFRGAIASVPFVDCLTTMMDETIPLSTGEYEEWGNPNDKIFYDYIKSYSPYNNVKKTSYPSLLVQTGYHDPRVQYWEPAKWVAKLRDYIIDDHLLLLITNMKSGHFGSTGRLEFFKLFSLYYAFLIGIEQDLIC